MYLTRIDGHAALVNRTAMDRGGPDCLRLRTLKAAGSFAAPRGEPTGVLIDRAQDLVSARIPPSLGRNSRHDSWLPTWSFAAWD